MNPAEIAAAEAQAKVYACLQQGRNFRLEAGAGAGKTYSLVEALKLLIGKQGRLMLREGQQIACITYTEVARDEIIRDIEEHPAILVETIHAFSWRLISPFQKALRTRLAAMPDKQDKITAGDGLEGKPIEYQLGFFAVEKDKVTLSHDDIPRLMSDLLAEEKFRRIITHRHPIIFIDEYQDTDKLFMAAITEHFLTPKVGPLIGLFGDHWQTIYRGDFDLTDYPNLDPIDKGANFRSAPAIVNVLNELRPELKQEVADPDAEGEADFYHANLFSGERTDTPHSKDDLPPGISQNYTTALKAHLEEKGWVFDPSTTKVLMLTHNAIAAEQGYPTIASIFDRNEAFAKKEDPVVEFLADTLEPLCRAYQARKYGDMFQILGSGPNLYSHDDKLKWREDMDALLKIRAEGTIGDVLDHLRVTARPRVPDRVAKREDDTANTEEYLSQEKKYIERHKKLRGVSYSEMIELVKYLDGSTTFATQHSVKGAQFENVLVILGGGWNHYKWPQLLELLETKKLDAKNIKGFYRARNLFYVAISRPKRRLAVLATQFLSEDAIATAQRLFGKEHVHTLKVDMN